MREVKESLCFILTLHTGMEAGQPERSCIYSTNGQRPLDFPTAISVTMAGHCYPKGVTAA